MNNDPAKAAKARALVASLLFVEAALIAALGLWVLVMGFTHENVEIYPLLGVLLFAVAGSVGLAISAIGYRRGKYFGRSPAVLANLIALGVVSYQVEAHLWWVAGPLAALAGTTLIAALRAIPTDN
jgi:membrane protein YdbS with pleckstrin-like domain